jgi:hypothetical protein
MHAKEPGEPKPGVELRAPTIEEAVYILSGPPPTFFYTAAAEDHKFELQPTVITDPVNKKFDPQSSLDPW